MDAPTRAVPPDWIEGRRNLDHVGADEIEAAEAAHELERLARGQAADLRRAGAGREGRVDGVDVEGEVGRAIADDAARLGDGVGNPLLGHLLHVDDADALVERPVALVGGIHRSANADLHHALRIEDAVLDRAAEGRAVGELLAAEIVVARVGMSIHMDHAERTLLPERAQDRIGDDVVAADRQAA